MKRILFCLLAILSLTAIEMSARTYCLVVGVSRQGLEGAGDLAQTVKDAEAIKKVMTSHSKDITMLTSKYATKTAILNKLKAMADAATDKDRIYFFFSGHGCEGAICAYDDLITYDDIVANVGPSKSKMIICFIDACHSGSAVSGAGSQASVSGKKNIAFMTGCRPDEYSYEDGFVGAGYFSQALVKGLRGKSDADADKRITVKELYKYIYNDVVTRSKGGQHPQLISPANIQKAAVIKWK